MRGGSAEVLVDGLAADTELASERRFGLAGRRPGSELIDLLLREGFPAAAVDAALLGERDPFTLCTPLRHELRAPVDSRPARLLL